MKTVKILAASCLALLAVSLNSGVVAQSWQQDSAYVPPAVNGADTSPSTADVSTHSVVTACTQSGFNYTCPGGSATASTTVTGKNLCVLTGFQIGNGGIPRCRVINTGGSTWELRATATKPNDSPYINMTCHFECFYYDDNRTASSSSTTTPTAPPPPPNCTTPTSYGTSPCVFTIPSGVAGSTHSNSSYPTQNGNSWTCEIQASCPAAGGTWSINSYTRRQEADATK